MIVREYIPLRELTTLRVGGVARYVVECSTHDDVVAALELAREQKLPWRVLGEGSNVLALDEGFPGVLIVMRSGAVEEKDTGGACVLSADAGVHWDSLVRAAAERGLWGIENLAGIPGTVGAAPVQNIGAYGSEVRDTIVSVEALDTDTNEITTFTNEVCEFGYRDSRFKRESRFIILSVAFVLKHNGTPALAYKDLTVQAEAGIDLSTPARIGNAVRSIRAQKFPNLSEYGTAGSFFKNPTIATDTYASLRSVYEGLPGFPNAEGVKIPLAFVLDKILSLRGHREGNVSLFERQPLVLVADHGATQKEIDAFANGIAMRVHDATGITIEREVRMFP